MENQIILTGMLTGETKKAALRDADLFVLPSYSEGFSIAVLEAMASHLPCLVSDKVGFATYIRQYKAAAITQLTVSDLTAQLENTMQDETLRIDYAIRAYRMVTENFDIHIIARQMLEAYTKIRQR